MGYQVQTIKNHKQAKLQITRGQFSRRSNKLMALPSRPSHKPTLCLFSRKICNVSLWDFCSPTVQCSTVLHSMPPLCHNNRNNAKHASTQAHIPLLERPYIEEGASHSVELQQTQHILRRRIGAHLCMHHTMSITNITTQVLPG